MHSAARSELNEAMARLADGDRAAFEPVYRAVWPTVQAFCRKLVGNVAAGEDAAQQALIKVFERATTFDERSDALSWVLAIAAWECRTARRRVFRAHEVHDAATESIAADGDSPEENVIAQNLVDAALEALGTMSAIDRETLLATIHDEARGELTSGPAFRKRRQRAIDRLRDVWRKLYGS